MLRLYVRDLPQPPKIFGALDFFAICTKYCFYAAPVWPVQSPRSSTSPPGLRISREG